MRRVMLSSTELVRAVFSVWGKFAAAPLVVRKRAKCERAPKRKEKAGPIRKNSLVTVFVPQ
jgi:hypothetical protein